MTQQIGAVWEAVLVRQDPSFWASAAIDCLAEVVAAVVAVEITFVVVDLVPVVVESFWRSDYY